MVLVAESRLFFLVMLAALILHGACYSINVTQIAFVFFHLSHVGGSFFGGKLAVRGDHIVQSLIDVFGHTAGVSVNHRHAAVVVEPEARVGVAEEIGRAHV